MSLPAALAMAALVPPPEPPEGPWMELGASLDLRRDVQLAESLRLRVGTLRPSGLRPGLGLTLSPLRELDSLGDAYTYRALDASLGVWWQAEGAWAPGLGLSAGAAAMAFQGPGGAAETLLVPRLGAESFFVLPLRDSVSLVASVALRADLRQVRLYVDELPVAELSPWTLEAGLSLRFGR